MSLPGSTELPPCVRGLGWEETHSIQNRLTFSRVDANICRIRRIVCDGVCYESECEFVDEIRMFDNGGDLVETSFLMQGLLTARQYFKGPSAREQELFRRITGLWESVEWDWYRSDAKSDFLYWHWSAQWGWQIHHPLIGWNEVMVTYLLAIASPTHGVPASMISFANPHPFFMLPLRY